LPYLCAAEQHSTAQHSTAQHSTAQHSTAQHSTAQHSTADNSPLLKIERQPAAGAKFFFRGRAVAFLDFETVATRVARLPEPAYNIRRRPAGLRGSSVHCTPAFCRPRETSVQCTPASRRLAGVERTIYAGILQAAGDERTLYAGILQAAGNERTMYAGLFSFIRTLLTN
jgi:hypothetical protein